MKKGLLLLVLLFSSAVQAAVAELNLALFLNQEDPIFAQAHLIAPNEASSLCGPTTMANFVQLLAQEKNLQTVAPATFVSAMAQTHHEVFQKSINVVTNGLTPWEFITFADIFLKKFNLPVKWQAEHIESTEGINLENLLSPGPSVLMLRFSDRQIREMGPPSRSFDPAFGDGGFNMEENFATGFHYVLKVHADKEQNMLWLIDPMNPSQWTKVKLRIAVDEYSQRKTIFLVPQSPGDFPNQAPNGRPFRWSISTTLTPLF